MVGRPGKYQPRFTSGELDALFAGNTDQGDYFKGASLMQNVRPFPQGGFGLTPGTRRLARARKAADGSVSACRIKSFTHSREAAYDLVFTDGYADVYGASGFLASIATPFSGALIGEAKSVQQIDTMVLFHQSQKPKRIRRMGSDTAWGIDDAPFVNIPNYDFGDVTYTNSVPSVWALSFFNISIGNHYSISVNSVSSPAIAYTGTAATDAANILAAVLAIPGVSAGVTMTIGAANTPSGVPIPSGNFGLEFSGAGNVGDGWSVAGKVADNANAAIIASHLQLGVLGGEPIMSAARGWPSSGVFYAGRLVLGGFKGAPNAALASQASNYWQLDTRLTTASAPFLIPIDADGAATIVALHQGRSLDFFTDAGEYWVSTPGLDRTSAPTVVRATTHGISASCAPVENEGATLFVDASAGIVHEFRYDISQQNYNAPPISTRASSLVRGVVDLDIRRPRAATDTAQLYCLRDDGVIALAHLLRSEEITAFTRRVTDGAYKAVNVNDRREATFAIVRTVGNSAVQFIEREDDAYLLDGAIDFDLGAPGLAVPGLADLEGAVVWAIADNIPQGPFRVSGGAIALQVAATRGYVGRWTPPRVRTLPQPRDVGPRTVVRRPCRVHTVRVKVVDTSSIAIGANGGPAFDVPLTRFGAALDAPLLSAPFTGEVAMEGLQGFSDDGIVEITQVRPGTLNVIGVTVEVDL